VNYFIMLTSVLWQHAATAPKRFKCFNVNFRMLKLYIYRMIQEESALRWEMIVWVILSKKVHTNMGPILNGYGVMGIF